MKMELTKNQMSVIKKTVADMCRLEGFRRRFFQPIIEGDTFDDLVNWITDEVKNAPVGGFETTRKNMELVASLFFLSIVYSGDIPSEKYETEELGKLFSFIYTFDDEEKIDFLVETLNRWAEYETPDELLIKEGFRKTA